jgi:uncharacterized membrane protein YfcA
MKRQRVVWTFWVFCLVMMGSGLVFLTFKNDLVLSQYAGTAWMFLILGLMAFFAEYVDSSLGMGYGTSLTPILIFMGFAPLQIVPAILLSELVSGVSAGLLHHRLGNVNFRKGSNASKIMWIMAACSIIGTIIAVILAVSLPKSAVKFYIGIMIFCIGCFIIIGKNFKGTFHWYKIVVLGLIAAFNKGISGGGYGPLVTGGQVVVGVDEKNAIGITSLAEGLVCLVGLILYIVLEGWPQWSLALPLMMGAILSVPSATWTVRVLPNHILRHSIGYATMFLGLLTMVKLMGF